MENVTELTPVELELYSIESIINNLTNSVQAHMDQTVRSKKYDSLISVCTYANSYLRQLS